MQPTVKCVIVDDEPKAIELLKQRLDILFPDLQVIGTYTEWEKGWEKLRTAEVDILFLDISMPQKSGLDFLKLFPKILFQVIFITAHSDYALDAIKFSAAGYVLKPIDDLELSFAVNKAMERVMAGQVQEQSSKNGGNSLKIGIPNLKGIDYINTDDILYFESINKYTKVVTKDHSVVSSYNLGEFKKLVEAPQFFQVHRAYIVNLHRVKRFESSGIIVMEDNMQIPVSKNIKAEFLSIFNLLSRTVGMKSKE